MLFLESGQIYPGIGLEHDRCEIVLSRSDYGLPWGATLLALPKKIKVPCVRVPRKQLLGSGALSFVS